MTQETNFKELLAEAQKLARPNGMFVVQKPAELLLYRKGTSSQTGLPKNFLMAKRGRAQAMLNCIKKILSR